MSHEFENGLFVGRPAWHGLGTVLAAPPSIEEAIKSSGLDWEVDLHDLYIQRPKVSAEDASVSVESVKVSHRATVRRTDNSVLGVVGPDYVPLQNREAFQWFQPFIEDKAAAIEAAGSLRSGKKVWILAKVADATNDIVKGDAVEQFILLAHAHDGSLSIRVGFTVIRVVCANTLALSMNASSSKLLKVKHTRNAKVALAEIREVMNLAKAEFAATAEQLRFLASVGCSETSLARFVREVFNPGEADNEDAATRLIKQIQPLFEAGVGAEFHRGTYWGALNALSEHVTHFQGHSQDGRVDSQWFGKGNQLLQRGLEVALEFAR